MTKVAIKNREYHFFRWNLSHYGRFLKVGLWKTRIASNRQISSELIYTYRCILTNDWVSTEKDIITFYNERGAGEKNFDIQNNDFGWSHLPFSFMAENMVFMMVTAMLKNFYLYLVRHISEKVKPLKKTSRLKAFILHFVSVPAKWVRTGRQNVLNLYTNKTYYSEVFLE